ncbi:MAG TPA: hypothetical protein VGG64_12390 [Pirellulales bacterium]|jgi:hypothetical protein
MTTPYNPEPCGSERDWAIDQLGLAGGESATQSAALARQLAGHSFLPPPDWQTLARVVAARRAPSTMTIAEGLMTGRRDVLREEVESFCAEFFQLEPAERRARDAELTSKCARHPPLLARLNKLVGGFFLAREPFVGETLPDVKALADVVRKLFVMRPHDRAIARQSFLQETRQEPQRWADAARALNTTHPEIARLDSVFLHRIANWQQEKRERVKAERRRKPQAVQAAKRAAKPVQGSGRNNAWIVSVIFVLLGMVSKCDLATNSRLPTAPSKFDMKQFNLQNLQIERVVPPPIKTPDYSSILYSDEDDNLRFGPQQGRRPNIKRRAEQKPAQPGGGAFPLPNR